MAKFFIDHPVFAMVIAIVTVIVGAVAIPTLPVATYPEVVPPVVQIIATYRGANSQDLEKTVAQPIEQQLVGLDGMIYFFSRSSNNGMLVIEVTYELGTDIDLATVKTQNKVNLALPLLPPEVQREGVIVKKVSSAFLMAIPLVATDGRYDSLFLNNYATINLVDKIGSIAGVGEARLVARRRLWNARLGQSGQDGEARRDRHRRHRCDPGAEPPERCRLHRPAPVPLRERTSSTRSTPPADCSSRSSSTRSWSEPSRTDRSCACAIWGVWSWARRTTETSAGLTKNPRASSLCS